MPALWLAQLLCPQRHALLALAYDSETTPAAEIEAQLYAAVGVGGIDPWCGLCGRRQLHIEHGKLFTDDWDVALPVLRASEAANLQTREALTERKRSTN